MPKKDEMESGDDLMMTKGKMPQASMGSYPEAKPDKKTAPVKKYELTEKALNIMKSSCKCEGVEKHDGFRNTIERVQKALARINKMDEIKKAKLIADLPNDLNPILGQGIADETAEIGNPKDFPEMDKHPVKMPQGLGVAKPGGEHQIKDPTQDNEEFDLDMEPIKKDPGHLMVKSWEESVDVLKGDMETWVPEALNKARVDEGLSPQRKASARAKRNDRHYVLNDKLAPKANLDRHNKFYHGYDEKKRGALAGRKGEKVIGKPKQGANNSGGMGHDSGGHVSGRSTAGVHTEWAKRHQNPGHAAHARSKAHELHSKKLSQIRSAPKPTFKTDDYEFTAKAEAIMKGDVPTHPRDKGVKGVHTTPSWQPDKGKSYAGTTVRAAHTSHTPENAKFQNEEAHEAHRSVLSEMRSMKKPNLPKNDGYEFTAKAENIMKASEHERGVHQPAKRSGHGFSQQRHRRGTSEAGVYTRASETWPGESRPSVLENVKRYKETAKDHHKQVLSEMRSMPKPALKSEYQLTGKAEAIMKAAGGIKGVHTAIGNAGSGSSMMGMTVPSKMASSKHKQASYSQAKAQAKTVLSELKTIKPKIP